MRLYEGVMKKAKGGYALWVGSSWASFKVKYNLWRAAGLNLIDLEVGVYCGQKHDDQVTHIGHAYAC